MKRDYSKVGEDKKDLWIQPVVAWPPQCIAQDPVLLENVPC